jgi:hypothetical protein
MLSRVSLVLVVSLALAMASVAEAQWPAPYQRSEHRIAESVPFVFQLETGFFTAGRDFALGVEVDGFAVPFDFGAFGTIADVVEVGALWGFGVSHIDVNAGALSDDSSGIVAFNPYLQGAYRYQNDYFVLRIGGGIAVPIADAGSDDGTEAIARGVALTYPAYMNGLWNVWLNVEDRVTLVLPAVRIDSDPREVLVWAAETELGIMIYTGDADQDTEVVWQIRGELGVRIDNIFVAGGRLSLVTIPTVDDGQDGAQLAVEPFFRAHFDPAFLQARFLMNLDDDLGFAFDDDGVWSIHVGGGAYL